MNSTDTPVQPNLQNDDLPVALIKQSHDLALDPDALGSADAVVVVPASATLKQGDRLTLSWQGFYNGVPESPWSADFIVGEDPAGNPQVLGIPAIEVLLLWGGEAQLSYARTPGGQSPVQVFRIDPPDRERLAAPGIAGHDPGLPLDPGYFPQGITLQVPAWDDLQLGDEVVFYWDGPGGAGSRVASLRIDDSHLPGNSIEFKVSQALLLANQGRQVSAFYQYARPGASRSSAALTLAIIKPIELRPPIVERAVAEGDPADYQGVMEAQPAMTGVYVRLPDTLTVPGSAAIELHWQGHPAGGQFIARQPVEASNPKRFHIPPSAVGANMGGGESKRFAVFYRLIMDAGRFNDSTPFNLRILPLSQERYPRMGWPRLDNEGTSTLSLRSVAASGEEVLLLRWPFMATEQRVTLRVAGVAAAGGALSVTVRDALPVSAHEMATGRISARVLPAFLQRLRLNEYITLTAQVSFDGGENQTSFRNNSGVRLVS